MKSTATLSVLLLVLVASCLSAVRGAEQQATGPKTARSLADNYLCPLCEVVVTYVEAYLSRNGTETEIINAVNSICNVAPPFFATRCDAFVDQWIVYLINLLVQGEAGPQVCQQIKACPAPASAAVQEPTTVTNTAITVLE